MKTKYDRAWDGTPANLRWQGVPMDPFGPGVRYDMRSVELHDRPRGEHGYDALSKCWITPLRSMSTVKPVKPVISPASVAILKKQEREAEYIEKALF